MSLNDQLFSQIQQLQPDERRWLMRTFLEPHPHKAGFAEIILRESRTPVWTIVGHLQGLGDLETIASDYGVRIESILAAISFYSEFQVIIDERLRQNSIEPAWPGL